ncbi:hypothetical protein GDO81_017865 [Engystomops pustulosus]|uniref:Reelin domain-containing protein n=1 Tax=Engystomops pustulosus TaxID=76066 RepID=A0AAV7A6X7_ENGPU|nr:hypothetical protein GDO81_017865 [Engystomops pustulosus]
MALFLQNIAVFFLASFPMYLYAYPNGQVTDSCVTMTPSHGVPAQTSSPPYILSLDKNTYSAGDKIKVTLGSSSGVTQFKGFLIQARSGSATVPVGSFVTSNSNSQTLTCTSAASNSCSNWFSLLDKCSKCKDCICSHKHSQYDSGKYIHNQYDSGKYIHNQYDSEK